MRLLNAAVRKSGNGSIPLATALKFGETMIIYQQVDEFYRKTGEKIIRWQKSRNKICDYCGESIDYDDPDSIPIAEYVIHPYDGLEHFYEEVDNIGNTLNNEMLRDWLFKQEYYSYHPGCDINMIVEAKEPKYGLCYIMFDARCKVVDKLVSEGHNLEELGIFDEN